METKVIKIDGIKSNLKNPKKHWVEKISESIREMGYIEPIVVDENDVILAGHGRLKALKEEGIGEVEVIVKRGLTEKQKEKYLLLSNKVCEAGGWDEDLLKAFENSLLLEVGFREDEINHIFEEEYKIKEEEIEIIPYNKIHFLISVPKDKVVLLNPIIENIMALEGVEVETGEN